MRTPSQTVGPFYSICLTWPNGPVAVPGGIAVGGRVLDGAGEVVPDALVETWDGERFARCGTDDEGRWQVVTAKAPYLDVSVFARGLLNRVVTRIYFADADNSADPLLASVDAARRGTLLAQPDGDGYRFDVILQGQDETVFFSL